MKKLLPVLLFLTASLSVFSQVKFEKGYIIDNNGTRTECLIENKDWVYNPDFFLYKLSESASPIKSDKSTIREFSVYNYGKYVRAIVQLDHSLSYPVSELSNQWSPEWKTDTLFLKPIVEGKASLYFYEKARLRKFFYTSASDSSIRQLVYKQYGLSPTNVKSNNTFKQQLLNDVVCGSIPKAYFEKMEYTNESLSRHFNAFNSCMGEPKAVASTEPKANDSFRNFLNIKVTPGMSYSSAIMSDGNTQKVDFGKHLFFRVGVEIEYVFGFNKNKWSLFAEPSYQSFESEKTYVTPYNAVYTYGLSYKTIEMPIGIRHHLYSSTDSRAFVNFVFLPPPVKYVETPFIGLGGNRTTGGGSLANLKPRYTFAFGAGYALKGLSLEGRYHFRQNLIGINDNYILDYQRFVLVFGFRFIEFKIKTAR